MTKTRSPNVATSRELSPLLDMAERVFQLEDSLLTVSTNAEATIEMLFSRADAPKVTDIMMASADLLAIAHALIEAARERGETDAVAFASASFRLCIDIAWSFGRPRSAQ